MKQLFLYACLILVSCSGCVKNEKACTPLDPGVEEPQIKAYAAANGLTAIKHASGLYYQIINPGTGLTPASNAQVTVGYVGKLLSGAIFDQNTSAKFPLSGLIEGWQIGIPLIKKGGKIKLIVPSSLAYGCNDSNGIPGNSVLFFEIDLIDVQ